MIEEKNFENLLLKGESKVKKILTCAVAAYNVSATIKQCLDSFVQSDKLNDAEIIIINDGSTDNTKDIVMSYVNKYPESFILIDKENEGYGSTYNVGFKNANGKYYKVVDGDDWVNPAAFGKLVEYLKKVDVDLAVSNFIMIDQKRKHKDKVVKFHTGKYPQNVVMPFRKVCNGVDSIKMHNVVFRTSILKNKNIVIDNMYYVDNEFIIYPMVYVKSCIFFNLDVYMYRVNQENQSVSLKGMQKNALHMRKVVEKLLFFYEDNFLKFEKERTRKNYIERLISEPVNVVYYMFLGGGVF